MNATAHDSALTSLDKVINLWPDDPGEDTAEMGLRQAATMLAVTGVALVGLFTAIVLQTAYHAAILLWIWFGLPLLFVAKAIAHIGRAGVDRIRHARAGAGSKYNHLQRQLALVATEDYRSRRESPRNLSARSPLSQLGSARKLLEGGNHDDSHSLDLAGRCT
jgi:hypothetical protein